MRTNYLQALSCTSVDDNSVIILGGRQFTIYDDYFVEENINIKDTDPRNAILINLSLSEEFEIQPEALRPTRVIRGSLLIDGYLWFVQYDNHKDITLKDFRLFMSKLNTNGGFDFNDAVNYIGVSFSDIPQIGF